MGDSKLAGCSSKTFFFFFVRVCCWHATPQRHQAEKLATYYFLDVATFFSVRALRRVEGFPGEASYVTRPADRHRDASADVEGDASPRDSGRPSYPLARLFQGGRSPWMEQVGEGGREPREKERLVCLSQACTAEMSCLAKQNLFVREGNEFVKMN